MVTQTLIAQRMLDENGYKLINFKGLTLTLIEYKIDDVIDYVNLMAKTSMAALTGVAEAKSLVYAVGENVPVKMLTNLLLQALLNKGENVGISAINVNYVLTNPDYAISLKLVDNAIMQLKENSKNALTPPIVVSNDPILT